MYETSASLPAWIPLSCHEVDNAGPLDRVSNFDKSFPRPVLVLSVDLALSREGGESGVSMFPPPSLIPVLMDEKSREAFLDEFLVSLTLRHRMMYCSFSAFFLPF